MKKLKLKLPNVVDNTRILIALNKITSEQSWRFETDDFGNKTNKLYEVSNFIEEEVDMNHIYFNDMVPDNRIIELPTFLKNKEILVRARTLEDVPMYSVDHKVILTEDTTLMIMQKIDY